MRAKFRVAAVEQLKTQDGSVVSINLTFSAVAAKSYPADGSDENNTFAKWTPNARLTMTVNNPALFDEYAEGDEVYVNFTKA